jgi:hypothetical protein
MKAVKKFPRWRNALAFVDDWVALIGTIAAAARGEF